jgi:hypothetical protein
MVRRNSGDDPAAPEAGRVVGLASVLPTLPAASAAPAALPPYFHNQPPLRHVTARPVTEHAPLTEATGSFVGEPQAPAPPPPPAPPAASLFPTPAPPRP